MKFDSSTIAVLLASLTPLLVFILAITWHRRQRRRVSKPPQTEKLLRPAGYSLSLRLEKTFDALINNLLAAFMLSAIAGGGIVVFASLLGANAPASTLLFGFLIAAPFITGCVWASLRAFQRFRETENIRLGISGEQAVAEALSEVADSGFRSFHDLQAEEKWNIDHVAVGTRGVFLIETKARRRRASRNGQPEHEVIYDGKFLQFPFYRDVKPIEQAKMNAKWLSSFLEKKTGNPVWVEPLVVLPGWFVDIPKKGNFPVKAMNTNYLAGYLRRQAEKLEPAQVRRIITALDEKCRDVEF